MTRGSASMKGPWGSVLRAGELAIASLIKSLEGIYVTDNLETGVLA